jgi:hypothetical protein
VVAKKCGYTIARRRGDVVDFDPSDRPAESRRASKRREASIAFTRAPHSPGNDKTGYCVIKQFPISNRLSVVFCGVVDFSSRV